MYVKAAVLLAPLVTWLAGLATGHLASVLEQLHVDLDRRLHALSGQVLIEQPDVGHVADLGVHQHAVDAVVLRDVHQLVAVGEVAVRRDHEAVFPEAHGQDQVVEDDVADLVGEHERHVLDGPPRRDHALRVHPDRARVGRRPWNRFGVAQLHLVVEQVREERVLEHQERQPVADEFLLLGRRLVAGDLRPRWTQLRIEHVD